MINNKIILITGGTGSFGNKMVETLFNNFSPKKIIIFSRDEFKQSEMAKKYPIDKYNILYLIGDIRDKNRLDLVFKNVDIIFHAAALKQVPALEYNPFEAIKTNIIGTQNIIESAIICNVSKVICISTDKSVNPINLYGGTKLCFEKLVIAGNLMNSNTKFSVLRYGNVFGSRGSVVPLFIDQVKKSVVTVTDEKMTRFTITLESAINFVLNCASEMLGGEIFVPKLQSYNLLQLTKIIKNVQNSCCEIKIIGPRPGEKIHELMISDSESHLTINHLNKYVVLSPILNNKQNYINIYGDNFCPPNWTFSSDNNELVSNEELDILVRDFIK